MNIPTWQDVEKAIQQGKNVFWVNSCIRVDYLISTGEYVLIGNAGVKPLEGHLKDSDKFIIEN